MLYRVSSLCVVSQVAHVGHVAPMDRCNDYFGRIGPPFEITLYHLMVYFDFLSTQKDISVVSWMLNIEYFF